MTDVTIAKDRGKRILNLLKLYGPLSFRGIKTMIEPKMKDRRVHDAIARLHRNGLIEKRNDRVFRGAGVFYQLSQHKMSQEKLAKVLCCDPSEFKQPYFGTRELIHAEACGLWFYWLKKWFPDAELICDYQFKANAVTQEIMLTSRNDFELRPDIIMIFKSGGDQHRVSIAFEIEKTRKSERRVHAKLNKYVKETGFDGLVYLCDSDEISELVRSIYYSKIMKGTGRVGHYGEFFFLFQNVDQLYDEQSVKTFRNYFTPVSIESWVDELRKTPMSFRRNEKFAELALSC